MNVPGVVAHGTHQSQGTSLSHSDSYGWDGHLFRTLSQHTQMTELASALSFPREQEPGLFRWRVGVALVVAGGGGLMDDGLGTLVFNVMLIGGFFGASLFLMGYAWSRPGLLRFLASAVGTFVTFGVGAYLLTNGGLNAPSALQSMSMVLLLILGIWGFVCHFRVRHAFRQAELERRRAYQIWQGLYYCSRDNVVFDPGSGRYGPPGAVRELIYPG